MWVDCQIPTMLFLMLSVVTELLSSNDEQAVNDTIVHKANKIATKEKCNFFMIFARHADSEAFNVIKLV